MRLLIVTLLSGLCLFASGELSGRRAPGFSLPNPDYSHFYDLQDYRGKVVVIDIMSTSCPHCMLLSTTLEKLKDKFGDQVQVLSVVLPPDNQDTIRKYVATNKISVPILCDQGQMTISYFNARPDQAKISVPHLFLIDKEGMIRNDWAYEESTRPIFEGPALVAEVEKLLK
jgi:peroxiredoxin